MPDAGGYVGTLAVQPDGAMNMIHMLYSLILMAIQKVLQAIFDDPEGTLYYEPCRQNVLKSS